MTDNIQLGATQDELRWGTIAHLSVLVGLLGIPGPVGPLAVWLIKRGESAFVEVQAKEALNFSLSVLIYLIALVLTLVIVAVDGGGEGVVVLALAAVALVITSVVLPIVAGVRVSGGGAYHYPLTLRLVK